MKKKIHQQRSSQQVCLASTHVCTKFDVTEQILFLPLLYVV